MKLLSISMRALAVGAGLAAAGGCTSNSTPPPMVMAPTPPPTQYVMATPVVVAAPVATQTPAPVAPAQTAPPGVPPSPQEDFKILKEDPAAPLIDGRASGVVEVAKLAQAGVAEPVMLLFVEHSDLSFEADAEDILYLNDLGVPSTVVAAMLQKDGGGVGAPAAAPQAEPPPAQTQPAPQQGSLAYTGAGATTQTTVTEVTTNYIPAEQQQVVVQQPVVAQQPVVVQQPVIVQAEPVVTYQVFYDSLRPYGDWVEVSGYGWCWRPTVVRTHPGWRPYQHAGRWMYSDNGWYWHSEYSWGWAPFHYGRWFHAGHAGWMWAPDTVWGPSWVTWRRGPDYCGWAPLPPRAVYVSGVGFSYHDTRAGWSVGFGFGYADYTFVHARHFHNRRVQDHVVDQRQGAQIYNNSTVINNYVVGNNNTIINEGISRDEIAKSTRSEIRRVSVKDTPSGEGRMIRPERLAQEGGNMVLYRPSPVATAGARPTQVSRTSEPGQTGSSLSSRGEPVRSTAGATAGPTSGRSIESRMPTTRGAAGEASTARRPEAPATATPGSRANSEPSRVGTGLVSTSTTGRPQVPPASRTPESLTNRKIGPSSPGLTPQTAGRPQVPTSRPAAPSSLNNLGDARSSTAAPTRGGQEGVSRPAVSAPAQAPARPQAETRPLISTRQPSARPLSSGQVPGARPTAPTTPSGRSQLGSEAPSSRQAEPVYRSTVPGAAPSQRQQPTYAPRQAPPSAPQPVMRSEPVMRSQPTMRSQPSGRSEPSFRTVPSAPQQPQHIAPVMRSQPTPSAGPRFESRPVQNAPTMAPAPAAQPSIRSVPSQSRPAPSAAPAARPAERRERSE